MHAYITQRLARIRIASFFSQAFTAIGLLLAAAAMAALTGGEKSCSAADNEASPAATNIVRMYIGTYTANTPNGSKGIYMAQFNTASGKLLLTPGCAAELANPSFLALHPTRPLLYAVGETASFGGKKAGAVTALKIDPSNGKLTVLNQKTSGGPGATHLAVDPSGRFVLAANYTGGSVVCLPIEADGSLGDAADFVQFKGSSVNRRRQESPHAHCAMFDPAGKFAFVADLGTDKVMIFRFDAKTGKLTPNNQPFATVKPGDGARHMNFDPTGRFLYVINELGSTMNVFRYDADQGTLAPVQTISTLPQGWNGISATAEVQVHPSGRFVYGSNRGHDSIVEYAADKTTGKLALIGFESTLGKHPRHFTLDPTGRFLLAANRDTNNIVVFRIDPATGKLAPTGDSITVPMPACVLPVGEVYRQN